MKVVPVIEGRGETLAVPRLLVRLFQELQIFDVFCAHSIRGARNLLVSESDFARLLQSTQFFGDAAIFIFDADDDCARNVVLPMLHWATEKAPHFPCGVVMARREYESWLLASIEAFQGLSLKSGGTIPEDATYGKNPEVIRSPKAIFENYGYKPTADQSYLTSKIDLSLAFQRSSSFRKLVREVVRVLIELRKSPIVPGHWIAEEVT